MPAAPVAPTLLAFRACFVAKRGSTTPFVSSAAACRGRRYRPRQVVQGKGDLPGAAAVGAWNHLRFISHLGPSLCGMMVCSKAVWQMISMEMCRVQPFRAHEASTTLTEDGDRIRAREFASLRRAGSVETGWRSTAPRANAVGCPRPEHAAPFVEALRLTSCLLHAVDCQFATA